MEEYERKLSINNPVLMAKTMSALIETIQEKVRDKSDFKKKEIAELKYLKEKFINADPNGCIISGKALIYLIKSGSLEVSRITSELVAMVPFAKNYRGMIMVLSDLLVMDLLLKRNQDKYICPFNLVIPQHPLITILIQNSDSWLDILNYLRSLYQTDDKILIENLNELFAPLYKYVMCDPFLKTPEYCRSKFLQFLVDEKQCNLELIGNILAWLQCSRKI
ncbi:hypothetical protein QE152_g39056 [Popillia japonica]|uniref:Uncharacterized protein n=1 Tax=Popillia japonica TaxID=7064 RepID=A0AAW1HUQ9_POPJA